MKTEREDGLVTIAVTRTMYDRIEAERLATVTPYGPPNKRAMIDKLLDEALEWRRIAKKKVKK